VSQINHCAFCVDINAATLAKRGVGPDKIAALADWRTSDLFDSLERAALAYSEAITRTDARIGDGLFARLRDHLDDDGIVELTGLIAFQNMSSKFNGALDVPAQGFCSIPVPDPVAPSPDESASAAEPGAGAATDAAWPSADPPRKPKN
ncbi:MAG: carboxymuconolactone decarboxylase family protein, partial [Alphaproteobacteria bacterium]|nr:carboxymuconolactone decarboxylase family protein [Alphaproteobacteria bacterium]